MVIQSIYNTLLHYIQKTSPSYNIALRNASGIFLYPLELFSMLISVTISELFLTICIPCIAFNIDVQIAQLLMIVYTINLYTCNFIKNVFCLPRPYIHTIKDEPQYTSLLSDQENSYGFPSSHSACTVGVCWFVVNYIIPVFDVGHILDPYYWIFYIWPCIVGLARIFLGVHSVVDVLGGYIVGLVSTFGFYIIVMSGILDMFLSAPISSILIVGGSIYLSLIHPYNGSFDDNIKKSVLKESLCVLGCGAGAMLAMYRDKVIPCFTPNKPDNASPLITYSGINEFQVRFAMMLMVILVMRILFKKAAPYMIPFHNQIEHSTYIKLTWLIGYIPFAWVLLDPLPALFGIHYTSRV